MLFSSLVFLYVFLPLVLAAYYLLPRGCRCGFLLLADLIFYGFGEPVFVLLMVGSIGMNYLGGLWIDRESAHRRAVLAAMLGVNILLLAVFKYAGFLTDTLRLLPFLERLPVIAVPLPIGISFYTFQAMSYLIDVYRGECRAQRSVVAFGAYLSLFPQLIAGPIVRYRDVQAELEDSHRESAEKFSEGAELFFIGLSKKVLLANPLGQLWDVLSADPSVIGAAGAWAGAVAFSMQIYFDFSGYSDMARGLGKMLGFSFCENFHYPYLARSVSEFWRRWHISLTTWFRDYVYIPLGGNRRGIARTLGNVLVVWMLTGLWHGARWNFVCWGLYYALILIAERLFLCRILDRLPGVIARLYTLVLVVSGWMLFALEDWTKLGAYIRTMFGGGGWTDAAMRTQIVAYLPLLAAGAVGCLPAAKNLFLRVPEKPRRCLATVLSALAIVLCTASLVSESYNPFLYFRF